ncbi:hypothetical protein CBL_11810 [Carabus blaptoides fortunei]
MDPFYREILNKMILCMAGVGGLSRRRQTGVSHRRVTVVLECPSVRRKILYWDQSYDSSGRLRYGTGNDVRLYPGPGPELNISTVMSDIICTGVRGPRLAWVTPGRWSNYNSRPLQPHTNTKEQSDPQHKKSSCFFFALLQSKTCLG